LGEVAMPPRISAVICTHNREQYLPSAINSLLDQDFDHDAYEIIVVDNRSADATLEIVAGYGERVRYVHEPKLGLAHARNAGWKSARGRWVALLDDDAIADRSWLRIIVQIFETVRPEPGCVGGPINPIWEAPRPRWLSDQLLTSLSILRWTDAGHTISDLCQEWLAGVNLAVPRAVLEEVGGFVVGLDRSGTRLLSSGDVFLQRRIMVSGRAAWYDPRVNVSHHVPAARLRPQWFRQRYYAQGLSDAKMLLIQERLSTRARVGAAFRETIALLRRPADVAALFRRADDPAAFTAHCFALIRVGYIAGLLGAV
jgi:glycosyltransferase involved in cell wall biosynthesis